MSAGRRRIGFRVEPAPTWRDAALWKMPGPIDCAAVRVPFPTGLYVLGRGPATPFQDVPPSEPVDAGDDVPNPPIDF